MKITIRANVSGFTACTMDLDMELTTIEEINEAVIGWLKGFHGPAQIIEEDGEPMPHLFTVTETDFEDLTVPAGKPLDYYVELADAIETHGDPFKAAFANFHGYIDQSTNAVKESYQGAYDSLSAWGEGMLEEMGNPIPENLRVYFDYEAYAKDLESSDYWTAEINGTIHVFRND